LRRSPSPSRRLPRSLFSRLLQACCRNRALPRHRGRQPQGPEPDFTDHWEDNLTHSPEFASTLGDKRLTTQISDYSVKASNDSLEREEKFLMRLAAIDTTGLNDQEKISRDCCCASLPTIRKRGVQRMGDARQPNRRHPDHLPELVAQLSFTTVKDYDDWIVRLHKLPRRLTR